MNDEHRLVASDEHVQSADVQQPGTELAPVGDNVLVAEPEEVIVPGETDRPEIIEVQATDPAGQGALGAPVLMSERAGIVAAANGAVTNHFNSPLTIEMLRNIAHHISAATGGLLVKCDEELNDLSERFKRDVVAHVTTSDGSVVRLVMGAGPSVQVEAHPGVDRHDDTLPSDTEI